jgi:tRNA (guanine37-N1)-methyltransferase
MRFDLVTIFPEFFAGPLDHGILRRARETGLVEVHVQDLRVFTKDRHRSVDDRPFGGGEGMVLKPEPLFEAVEALLGRSLGSAEQPAACDPKTAIVLMSAAGKLFRQETARRYAALERIVFLCGRYEGVDERVAEHLATEEISVGDYVLSGGELPAMLVIDAVTRLIPGALGNEASSQNESFTEHSASGHSPLAGAHHAASLQVDAYCRRGESQLTTYESPSAGFSALYEAGRFSRVEGARGVDRGQSRGSCELAPGGRFGEDPAEPAGFIVALKLARGILVIL